MQEPASVVPAHILPATFRTQENDQCPTCKSVQHGYVSCGSQNKLHVGFETSGMLMLYC